MQLVGERRVCLWKQYFGFYMIGPLFDDGDGVTQRLNATLTIGNNGSDTFGADSSVPYGGMSDTTFDDAALTSRTIQAIVYNTTSGTLSFVLVGGVPNTPSTFQRIIVNGTTLYRADASYSSPGTSVWNWIPGSNIIGTVGMINVQVWT